jgi:hypothetical protein
MRTTVVLVILLLTLGLSLGPAPAVAEDNAVFQQMPASCQRVSDVELSQVEGKFFTFNQIARCVYPRIPEQYQPCVLKVYQFSRCLYSYFKNHSGNNVTNGTNPE